MLSVAFFSTLGLKPNNCLLHLAFSAGFQLQSSKKKPCKGLEGWRRQGGVCLYTSGCARPQQTASRVCGLTPHGDPEVAARAAAAPAGPVTVTVFRTTAPAQGQRVQPLSSPPAVKAHAPALGGRRVSDLWQHSLASFVRQPPSIQQLPSVWGSPSFCPFKPAQTFSG